MAEKKQIVKNDNNEIKQRLDNIEKIVISILENLKSFEDTRKRIYPKSEELFGE